MQLGKVLAPATASCIFVVYIANVMIGAAGGTIFLSDVGEMLTLFASCVCFVIFMLQRERVALSGDNSNQ